MHVLGPLSSTSGSRIFYVNLSPQLDTSESLSTVSVTSNNSNMAIVSPTILTSDVTTRDGTVLPANKTVYFRVNCSGGETTISQLTVDYTTDASNRDKTIVRLKIAPQII